MGHIDYIRVPILNLTHEDIEKQEERRKRHTEFPKPTRGYLAFCEKLNPCPICGCTPEPNIVGEYGHYSIKLTCSGSAFHLSIGDWYKSLAKAGRGWNRRTRDEDQIRHSMKYKARSATKQ